MTFHAGETYPDSEACNACTCSGNNLAACTEMACIPSQGEFIILTHLCKMLLF